MVLEGTNLKETESYLSTLKTLFFSLHSLVIHFSSSFHERITLLVNELMYPDSQLLFMVYVLFTQDSGHRCKYFGFG